MGKTQAPRAGCAEKNNRDFQDIQDEREGTFRF